MIPKYKEILSSWIYDTAKQNINDLSNKLQLDVNSTICLISLFLNKINDNLNNYNENKIDIELKNVYFKYHNSKKEQLFNLNNVSFKILKGKFHAFIGENGAGKSTTIKVILGLLKNYSGDILIHNQNIKENINCLDSIAFIPDKAIFPSNFNTYDYLYYTALLSNNNKIFIKQQIQQLLKEFEIEELKKKNPNKTSAGQKKKILLICAILKKSQIIILDEPAANLDPTTRIIFFEKLKKMQLDEGITIFISTHNLDEIKNYADYATFIKKGKILKSCEVNKDDIIDIYKDNYILKKYED